MENQETKEVKMNVVKNAEKEEPKQQKYTYEELNNICIQLSQQNQELIMQLRQANQVNMFKRLDYLFKVVEIANSIGTWHFNDDFIQKCIEEIQEAMTIPTEETGKEG